MKRLVLLVAALVVLSTPVGLYAQNEGLTIEGLAGQLSSLVSRVELLEKLHFPQTPTNDDGACLLAANGGLHPTTTAAYMGLSDNQVPDDTHVEMVEFSQNGSTAITINVDMWDDIYVIEFWNGCEFDSHSRFWEQNYDGTKTWIE